MCYTVRCDVMLFYVDYMNIHSIKMAKYEDDDALMLSEYKKRAHAY